VLRRQHGQRHSLSLQGGRYKGRGKPETVVAELPSGGHSTRNIVFTRDESTNAGVGGARASNDAREWGASWRRSGASAGAGALNPRRAAVLPSIEGTNPQIFATGIPQLRGMAVHPLPADL